MNRLVWFRNELRLDDNQTLTESLADKTCKVSFLFVYDKAFDTKTPEGQVRMAPYRKKFLAESVHSLRLSDHMNDRLILKLVAQLNGRKEVPDDVVGKFSYFATLVELNEKQYRLVRLLENDAIYIGVVNAYRDKRRS